VQSSNLSRKNKLVTGRSGFASRIGRRMFKARPGKAVSPAKVHLSHSELPEKKLALGNDLPVPVHACPDAEINVTSSRAALAIEELELARKAQAGDHAAFTRLVEPHIRKTYHVALRITRNREDAEDASQQSLINAYSHMDQFRGQARFSSWLLRIAINEALIKVRKRRSEDRHLFYETDPEQGISPTDSLRAGDASHPEIMYSAAENQSFLHEAIDGLGKTTRAVVHLLGIQERQAREAAGILNLSQSAVKTRFSRARRQMRESIARQISNGSCHAEHCEAF
jgi:RNA polymerase sigma-70 factor (ECF subfamily)